MERECLTKREKGTTINGSLRLAAKRHESAESVNLTWTEYQAEVYSTFGNLLVASQGC